MGSLKNERLLIQVRCRSKRSSTDGRVDEGSHLPPPPTDPDVRN
jgi:hypothetical protein